MISGNIFIPYRGKHSMKKRMPEGLRIMGAFIGAMTPLLIVIYLWFMGVI